MKKTQVQEEQAAVLVVDALTSGGLRDLRLAIEAMLPNAKPFQVQRSAAKYVQSTLQLVVDSLVRHGIQDDQLALSLHDLDHASGRVKIGGKLQYIASLLHRTPATRLLTVDFRGNEGKLSRVSLNPIYERAFISLLAQVAESSEPGCSAPSTACDHEVAVDLATARSFMRKTRATLDAQADLQTEYARSLLRNLLIAQKLLKRVVDAAGSPYLQEIWSQSDSGRMYGKELSLQRVPAQVREAFIGRCYKYDFMASSYALLTGLVKSYETSLQTGDVEHYVNHRASIRKHVAKQVDISIDKVKAIFTALGFGADLADNRHKAIRRMLTAEQYASLLANEHFCRLRDRMDEVRDIVVKHFDPAEPFLGFQYAEDGPGTSGKKRSKNQMLAWIYQRMESEALYRFVMLAREFKQDAILTAHDCVYFKAPLPADVQADIAVLLRKEFPLLRFEPELVIPIHADDDTTTWTVNGNPLVASRTPAKRQELAAASHGGELPLDAYFDQLTHEINPDFCRDTALGKSIQL